MLAVADDVKPERAAPRDRLAARRRALGLTQEDLAARLQIERSTVVRWEAGATRPLPWLQPKLARALHVPAGQLAELLGGPAPPGPGDRGPAAAPVPRQLPAAVAGFTGRAGELAARLPPGRAAWREPRTPRQLSGACLEDEVERGFGGAAEPGEPGRADHVGDPSLTGLRPEGEPDLLRQ